MSRYQKWTVTFLILTSVSLIFGQAAKTTFTYAPLAGWGTGLIFLILSAVMAVKAYNQNI